MLCIGLATGLAATCDLTGSWSGAVIALAAAVSLLPGLPAFGRGR